MLRAFGAKLTITAVHANHLAREQVVGLEYWPFSDLQENTLPLDTAGNPQSTRAWWEQRWLRYNIGLIVAGLLAFGAYVAVVDRGVSKGTMPGAEITLFTTAFQAFGYLLMMAVANVCYLVGPWSESIVRPRNIERYRRVTYWLGFCFSVLLPFTIPALVAWSYIIHPGTVAMPEP